MVFGYAATIIPRAYTYYISTLLFALFGLKMLRDGYYMSPTEAQEELEEVQSDLRKRDDEVNLKKKHSFIQQYTPTDTHTCNLSYTHKPTKNDTFKVHNYFFKFNFFY